uniref:Uncharacterized protein n=1 Tax=Oryza glumipatula TaxID=40148 RepID=A0A0D9Z0Z1_9ORYZ
MGSVARSRSVGRRAAKGEKRRGERKRGEGKKGLTCGTHVGPPLSQLPHRIKPESKLPRDLSIDQTVLPTQRSPAQPSPAVY